MVGHYELSWQFLKSTHLVSRRQLLCPTGEFSFIFFLQIVFVFVSSYKGGDKDFDEHIIKHGDGVKDVAFEVEDLEGIVQVNR